jgi:Cdc6-like AAA superfamily ATPase
MSWSVQSVLHRLRGRPREERIFYQEFVRVIDRGDVQPAVKDQVRDEYFADPPGFAKRLLTTTEPASVGPVAIPRRSPFRKLMRVLRIIMLGLGLLILAGITLDAITGGNIRAAVISIAIWILILLGKFSGPLSRLSIFRLNNFQDAEAKYRDDVRIQLTEYLNVLANRLDAESLATEEEVRRRAAEQSAEVVLATTEAPRLVELDSPEPVRVRALQDLQVFIVSHVTSAIGISGPRGIGKTTIMRLLCMRNQDRYVGVYLPAPVKYSPADFVRTIHQRTAEEILEAHGAMQQEPSLLARRNGVLTVRLIAAFGLLLFATSALLIKETFFPRMSWSLATGWGSAFLAAASLAILALSYFHAFHVQRLRDKHPVNLARAELERLAWSTRTQTSSKNSFAFRALSVEDSSMTELVEREASHLQHVDAFKKFAALYRNVSDRIIIVAIDELDKISTPDEAIDVINSLKDLMHSEGIHFLVSVSEDALARFALRGIPLRDAFDSTFDTIIEVDRFSAADAATLLQRRVVGMPQVLAYYCHALSGGIPRDLIRFCRQCVDFGRQAETSAPTSTVVTGVARDHAMGLLKGAAIQARQEGLDSLRSLLEVQNALTAARGESLFGLLDSAATFLWDERLPDEQTDVVPALPVVLAVVSTASCYFGREWTAASWRAEAESGSAERITNSAAGCMADAGIDTTVALEHLAALRKELELEPLGMDAS